MACHAQRRADLSSCLKSKPPESTTLQVAAALAQRQKNSIARRIHFAGRGQPNQPDGSERYASQARTPRRFSGTGRDAIARCAAQHYDLVLMDIQMPETDGLEATLQIRAAEKTRSTRQTIIALTAHAMPSDRQRCQEVGMDGFLVKPIAFDALKQAVDSVLQSKPLTPNASLTAARSEPAPDLTMEPAEKVQKETTETLVKSSSLAESAPVEDVTLDEPFDANTILSDAPNWQTLLQMFSGNANLLEEVLGLLVREAPRLRRLFEASLERGNCAEARRAVHTLKSNVRYVGLTKMASVAEQLERRLETATSTAYASTPRRSRS